MPCGAASSAMYNAADWPPGAAEVGMSEGGFPVIRKNLPEGWWKKSSYSGSQQSDCVETQRTADGLVAVGDSKQRALGAFVFPPAVWGEFVRAVRRGEFGGV